MARSRPSLLIFGVCQYRADEYFVAAVVDRCDQSVFVAADIEHRQVVTTAASVRPWFAGRHDKLFCRHSGKPGGGFQRAAFSSCRVR